MKELYSLCVPKVVSSCWTFGPISLEFLLDWTNSQDRKEKLLCQYNTTELLLLFQLPDSLDFSRKKNSPLKNHQIAPFFLDARNVISFISFISFFLSFFLLGNYRLVKTNHHCYRQRCIYIFFYLSVSIFLHLCTGCVACIV